jgi:glycine oxidase
LGVLDVRDGGAIPIPALVRAVLAAAARRGAVVRSRTAVRGWRTTPHGVAVETSEATFHARHLVLAAGDGLFDLLPDGRLPLHRVKGQTVVVERPPGLDLPAVSGAAYTVPQGDTVVVGASFEHVFADLAPSEAVGTALLAQAAALVPALAGAPVVAHRAGVRLTVPVRHAPGRLPLLDALPGHLGVWVFAGLGAKGLLTAPLLAATLDARLDGAPPHPDLPRL